MVRVAGFEPTASWSRTKRATNCATPGCNGVYYTEFFLACQGSIGENLRVSSKRIRDRGEKHDFTASGAADGNGGGRAAGGPERGPEKAGASEEAGSSGSAQREAAARPVGGVRHDLCAAGDGQATAAGTDGPDQ